jgi:predicted dehydrogenase
MVRAVLVGCGAMSAAWLAAARETGVEMAGLVDVDPAHARDRAVEFGLDAAVVGTHLDAVLAETRPDVVFDAALPASRRAIVETALRHSAHVLTEKPLAASPEDARAIVAAAQHAGRLHAVVQNRRYLAEARRIRRFLDSGAIGTPTSIHCEFFVPPHFGGFREEMDHVLLLDMAIHTFDSARFLSGADPRGVFCREWEPKGTWYRQGSAAAAIFEMTGDMLFTYVGSWCADGLRTSWESSWRIVGEKGSLTWDGYDGIRSEVRSEGREGLFDNLQPVEVPSLDAGDRIGGHLGVIQDFLAAVESGKAPETQGTDNIKSLAMVFGAIESAETGRYVEIGA